MEERMRGRAGGRGKWKLLLARLYFIAATAASDGNREQERQEGTHQKQGERCDGRGQPLRQLSLMSVPPLFGPRVTHQLIRPVCSRPVFLLLSSLSFILSVPHSLPLASPINEL